MNSSRRNQQVRRGSSELPHPKCVYCVERNGVEREHVIASCFYDQPFPGDLPKVPACKECNGGRGDGGHRDMSLDEGYMRDRMLPQMGVDEHPDAGELIEKVRRSLNRPEGWREKQVFQDSMVDTCVELEPNVYLHGVVEYSIDLSRFSRVMKKMVRGLYAYHLGTPMPKDYGMVVLPRLDLEMFHFFKGKIAAHDPSPIFNPGGRYNVCYRFGPSGQYPLGNNWLFVFFSRYSFCVHAGPKRDIDPQTQQLDGNGWRYLSPYLRFSLDSRLWRAGIA